MSNTSITSYVTYKSVISNLVGIRQKIHSISRPHCWLDDAARYPNVDRHQLSICASTEFIGVAGRRMARRARCYAVQRLPRLLRRGGVLCHDTSVIDGPRRGGAEVGGHLRVTWTAWRSGSMQSRASRRSTETSQTHLTVHLLTHCLHSTLHRLEAGVARTAREAAKIVPVIQIKLIHWLERKQ